MSRSNGFWEAATAAGFAGLAYLLLRDGQATQRDHQDVRLYAASRSIIATIADVMRCRAAPIVEKLLEELRIAL